MNASDEINSTISPLFGDTAYRASDVFLFEIWSSLTVQTSVCIIGAALNVINVIVFQRLKTEATPYLYMTSLAVTDAGTLIIYLPTGFARCDRRIPLCGTQEFNHLRSVLSYYITYIGFAMGNLFEAISAWTTVLICIERFVTMKWPHHGKLKFSRPQAKWQLFGIAILNILFHIPMFFVLKIVQFKEHTSENVTRHYQSTSLTGFGKSHYYYGYTWIRFGLVQCVPLVLLCIVNLLLFLLIWSSYEKQRMHQTAQDRIRRKRTVGLRKVLKSFNKRTETVAELANTELVQSAKPTDKHSMLDGKDNENSGAEQDAYERKSKRHSHRLESQTTSMAARLDRAQRANLKLSILLAVVILLFLIGQIPQAISYVHIIKLFIPTLCTECLPYVGLYQHLSHLLCLLTSTTNFFLYLTLNRHYRVGFNRLFCHCA